MFFVSRSDQLMSLMNMDQQQAQLASQASTTRNSDAMMMLENYGLMIDAQQQHFAQQQQLFAGSCGSRGKVKTPCCQVPGCMADLAAEPKAYCLKKRICSRHMAADVLPGTPAMRFCFQCAKVEPLTLFDSNKRSCRASLQRRKTRPAMAASSQQLTATTSSGAGTMLTMVGQPAPCAFGADSWYAPPGAATGHSGSLGTPCTTSHLHSFAGDVWSQLQPGEAAGPASCVTPDAAAMILPPVAPAPLAAAAPAGGQWHQQSDTTGSPKTVSQGGADLFFEAASSASPPASPSMRAAAAKMPRMLLDGSSTRFTSCSTAPPPPSRGAGVVCPSALSSRSMPDPASLQRTALQLRSMEDELQALHSHLRSLQQALLLQHQRGTRPSSRV